VGPYGGIEAWREQGRARSAGDALPPPLPWTAPPPRRPTTSSSGTALRGGEARPGPAHGAASWPRSRRRRS